MELSRISPNSAPASIRPFAGPQAWSTRNVVRRDEQAENDHAAEPHDERRQREVPDDEHPVIIIAGVDDAAIDRTASGWCCERWRARTRTSGALDSCCARYATRPRRPNQAALGPRSAARRRRSRAGPRASAPLAHAASSKRAAISDDAADRRCGGGSPRASATTWPAAGTPGATRAGRRGLPSGVARAAGRPIGASSCRPRSTSWSASIAVVYEPGEGVAHTLSEPGERAATLSDQVATASALLTAYAVTGRLPYPCSPKS